AARARAGAPTPPGPSPAASEAIRQSRRLERMLPVGPGHLAAQPRRAHQLARVRQPGRIERAAQPLERVEVLLGEHLRHVLLLVDADTVLARDRPARVQAGVDDQPRELLGALGVALLAPVVTDQRVQVAVAR